MLGFSGCRNLSGAPLTILKFILAAASGSGKWSSFGVGCCATGLDSAVRNSPVFQAHVHQVFAAQSQQPRHLVARSAAMAKAVAGSKSGGLIAFPGKPCPLTVSPSKTASVCFCGAGSGTWATAALVVGCGGSLWVAGLPASDLPAWWGTWSRSPRFPGCWQLTPAPGPARQLGLFS